MRSLWIFLFILCIEEIKSTFYHGPPIIQHSPLHHDQPPFMPSPTLYLPPLQPYPLYVVMPKHLNGPCMDVQGQYIHYGGLYFDGIYWRICGMSQKVKPGYGILERKWQMVFRMLDANKDNVMSAADATVMTDLFAKYFGLNGKFVDPVRRSVSLVWRLLLLHKSDTGTKPAQMTEFEFVQHMWSSYTLRRKMLFTTIMKITDLLLFVTDNNKDGYISFPEWNVLFTVLGCHDERAKHFLFKYTGPNFWGHSSILGARQLIMNLILDQDPHYFFKFENILDKSGLVSGSIKPTVKPVLKPTIKPAIKPALRHVSKPVMKPSINPSTSTIIKPGLKPANQPVSSTAVKPILKTVMKPMIKPVIKNKQLFKNLDNGNSVKL